MSAREWKPGDVAMVGYDGQPERPMLRAEVERAHGLRACWLDSAYRIYEDQGRVQSARPLVVIDPEDREAVERLADELVGVGAHKGGCGWDLVQAALREFANPTPPRIDEPGTWGVVKASCPHSDTRREWVHHPDGNWWPAFDYSTVPERTPLPDDWADLIDPVLVREGVTQ